MCQISVMGSRKGYSAFAGNLLCWGMGFFFFHPDLLICIRFADAFHSESLSKPLDEFSVKDFAFTFLVCCLPLKMIRKSQT